MPKTLKIANVDEVGPGTCKSIDIETYSLALYNVDGTFYVTDNLCPHMGAPLGDGGLYDDIVVCPWHEWKFDVKDGTCLAAPGELDVETYSVEIKEGSVYVVVE